MSEWGQFVYFNTPTRETTQKDLACTEIWPHDMTDSSKEVSRMQWTQLAKLLSDESSRHSVTMTIPIGDTSKHPIRRHASYVDGLDTISRDSSMTLYEPTEEEHQNFFIPKCNDSAVEDWDDYQKSNAAYVLGKRDSMRDSFGRLLEKKGILLKRGFHWRKAWVERLVVLHNLALEYYECEDEEKPARGRLELTTDTICRPSTCDGRNFCFEVVPSNGCSDTWYLQAPCRQTLDSWVSTINAAIEYIGHSKLFQHEACERMRLLSSETISDDGLADSRFVEERRKKCNRSPPVTPPMQIYYSNRNGTPHEAENSRMILPPSPRISICGDKTLNFTWPAPNYKFADTDKVDTRKGHEVIIQ